MTEQPEITRTLATFVAQARWEDLPQAVRHEAKRAILNFIGTALAGCREDAIVIALASLQEFSGPRQATLIGRTERLDALGAAFINAAGGNVTDFDDTHLRTVINVSRPHKLFQLTTSRVPSPYRTKKLLYADWTTSSGSTLCRSPASMCRSATAMSWRVKRPNSSRAAVSSRD